MSAMAAQRLARERHAAQLEAMKTAAAEAQHVSVGCDANSHMTSTNSSNHGPADSNSPGVTDRPTVDGEGPSSLGKHPRDNSEDEEEDGERRQGSVEAYDTADQVKLKPRREPVCMFLFLCSS